VIHPGCEIRVRGGSSSRGRYPPAHPTGLRPVPHPARHPAPRDRVRDRRRSRPACDQRPDGARRCRTPRL